MYLWQPKEKGKEGILIRKGTVMIKEKRQLLKIKNNIERIKPIVPKIVKI